MSRLRVRIDDPGLFALKAAVRATVVTVAVFALAFEVIGDSEMALFAAFGAFALLSFVDFDGPWPARLGSYLWLAAAGALLIVIGTLCSREPWLAAGMMLLIGFVVLFSGVVNSALAGAAVSLLLLFVLPVMVPGPPSDIPARLEGWALACAASIATVMLLWPRRPHDQVVDRLAVACRALADLVRSPAPSGLDAAVAAGSEARRTYQASPYRPAGTTRRAAALARLVNDVGWMAPFQPRGGEQREPHFPAEAAGIKSAVVDVLTASGLMLEGRPEQPDLGRLELYRGELSVTLGRHIANAAQHGDESTLAAPLDEAFRLRLLSYGAHQIGVHALLAMGLEEPSLDTAGEYPSEGPSNRLTAAREVAASHASPRSVWFRNSLRGAIGLAVAVLVGQLADLQHAFWVVLGALSVLRSNALTTGSTVLRALAGTTVGIVVGGALLVVIGGDTTLLWVVLPPSVLLAAYAPRAISFAVGQAAFTVFVLVLFQLITPTGLTNAGVRLEDIALGCAISFGVGLLFWPRGAAAVVRNALASALSSSADFMAATIDGLLAGDRQRSDGPAREAIDAGRRLDDALAQYLAERSTARLDGDSLAALTAGAARVRWSGDIHRAGIVLFRLGPMRDRSPALLHCRHLLDDEVSALHSWYLSLGESISATAPPPAATGDGEDDAGHAGRQMRYLDVPGPPSELAQRLAIAWTGHNLDILRDRQPSLAEAAAVLAGPRIMAADPGRSPRRAG